MKKKVYSQKYDTSIKLPKRLYQALARNLEDDQVAEFYLSFEEYMHDQDKTVKEIITAMACMAEFVESETFLTDLNRYSDKEGNVNWKNLLELYERPDTDGDVRVIYKN